ncbi:hypothetical protein AVEN_120807-1 [Araneus ventricosus]|uniref:Uncharacterized protein n=1 Tax=Araneus ventricosus TaxID=182803 RepID=A0A4Y2FAB5_ARAVE|nr:hypothetical protein AVEN_120807-1 [Araneus ventricosus]
MGACTRTDNCRMSVIVTIPVARVILLPLAHAPISGDSSGNCPSGDFIPVATAGDPSSTCNPITSCTRTDFLLMFPVAHVILLSLSHAPISVRQHSRSFFHFFSDVNRKSGITSIDVCVRGMHRLQIVDTNRCVCKERISGKKIDRLYVNRHKSVCVQVALVRKKIFGVMSVGVSVVMITQKRNKLDRWNLICGLYTTVVNLYHVSNEIRLEEDFSSVSM